MIHGRSGRSGVSDTWSGCGGGVIRWTLTFGGVNM